MKSAAIKKIVLAVNLKYYNYSPHSLIKTPNNSKEKRIKKYGDKMESPYRNIFEPVSGTYQYEPLRPLNGN